MYELLGPLVINIYISEIYNSLFVYCASLPMLMSGIKMNNKSMEKINVFHF